MKVLLIHLILVLSLQHTILTLRGTELLFVISQMTHRSEEESFKAVLLLNCQPPVFTPLGQPSTENKIIGSH